MCTHSFYTTGILNQTVGNACDNLTCLCVQETETFWRSTNTWSWSSPRQWSGWSQRFHWCRQGFCNNKLACKNRYYVMTGVICVDDMHSLTELTKVTKLRTLWSAINRKSLNPLYIYKKPEVATLSSYRDVPSNCFCIWRTAHILNTKSRGSWSEIACATQVCSHSESVYHTLHRQVA